jgi:hypothetical protein
VYSQPVYLLVAHACPCCPSAGTSQLVVVEKTLTSDGSISQRPLVHQPLLVSCTSDTPARCKLAKFCGHAAFLGCGVCSMHGTNVDPDGKRCGMHFLGYSKEADGGIMVPGIPSVSGYCGDGVFQLTHDDHLERAEQVDSGHWKNTRAGCNGLSPVIKILDYTRYDRVFACSVAHAMLLGLLKDFWGLLLCKVKQGEEAPWYSLPKDVRRVMAARASHITSTLDQSRSYRCVVTKRGNWVMEDWLNWAEIWSVYIMSPKSQVCGSTLC